MKNLTDKTSSRYEVYKAFYEHVMANHGLPPTMRWLKAHTSLGSTNTVSHHIDKLSESGLLARLDDGLHSFTSRGLYIPGSMLVVGDSYKPDAPPMAYCKVLVIDGRVFTPGLVNGLNETSYSRLTAIYGLVSDLFGRDKIAEVAIETGIMLPDIYSLSDNPLYKIIDHALMGRNPDCLAVLTKDRHIALCALGMGCRVYDPDIEVPGWDDSEVQS